ncbi:MAG: strawberry notch C-terminal domain-containing protein [Gemmatimonadales bacterium]
MPPTPDMIPARARGPGVSMAPPPPANPEGLRALDEAIRSLEAGSAASTPGAFSPEFEQRTADSLDRARDMAAELRMGSTIGGRRAGPGEPVDTGLTVAEKLPPPRERLPDLRQALIAEQMGKLVESGAMDRFSPEVVERARAMSGPEVDLEAYSIQGLSEPVVGSIARAAEGMAGSVARGGARLAETLGADVPAYELREFARGREDIVQKAAEERTRRTAASMGLSPEWAERVTQLGDMLSSGLVTSAGIMAAGPALATPAMFTMGLGEIDQEAEQMGVAPEERSIIKEAAVAAVYAQIEKLGELPASPGVRRLLGRYADALPQGLEADVLNGVPLPRIMAKFGLTEAAEEAAQELAMMGVVAEEGTGRQYTPEEVLQRAALSALGGAVGSLPMGAMTAFGARAQRQTQAPPAYPDPAAPETIVAEPALPAPDTGPDFEVLDESEAAATAAPPSALDEYLAGDEVGQELADEFSEEDGWQPAESFADRPPGPTAAEFVAGAAAELEAERAAEDNVGIPDPSDALVERPRRTREEIEAGDAAEREYEAGLEDNGGIPEPETLSPPSAEPERAALRGSTAEPAADDPHGLRLVGMGQAIGDSLRDAMWESYQSGRIDVAGNVENPLIAARALREHRARAKSGPLTREEFDRFVTEEATLTRGPGYAAAVRQLMQTYVPSAQPEPTTTAAPSSKSAPGVTTPEAREPIPAEPAALPDLQDGWQNTLFKARKAAIDLGIREQIPEDQWNARERIVERVEAELAQRRVPPSATPKVQTALGDFRKDAAEGQIQDLQEAARLVLDRPEGAPRTPTQLDRWGEGILGTKDFTLDDVYDAFEGAANQKVIEQMGPQVTPGAPGVRGRLGMLRELEDTYFKGRVNSGAMKELQQFSTPLPIAEAATYLAGVRDTDKVLEPSAGTGNLINALRGTDAKVHANELSPRRAAVLRTQGHEVTTEDALRLPLSGRRYNVVITNPPYGSIKKSQYSGFGATPFGATDLSQRFIASAMESLADGGRIVAVMPENTMKTPSAGFRKWLEENHTPVAFIQSPPESYRSRGVRSGSVIMVVDKGKREGAPAPLVVENPDWAQWYDTIEQFADGTPYFRQPAPTAVDGTPVVAPKKPRTPQVAPLEGMTPLGVSEPATKPAADAPLEGRGERKARVGIESITVSRREGTATSPKVQYEEEYEDGSRVTRAADGSIIEDRPARKPAAPAESTKPAVDPIQEAASQIADAVAKAIEQRLPVRQETRDDTRASGRPEEAPGDAPGDRSEPARGGRGGGDRGSDERPRGPGPGAASGERDPGVVAPEAPGDAREAADARTQSVVPLVPRRRVEARPGDSEQRRLEIEAANDSPVFAPYSVDVESSRAPHPRVVVETRSMAGMHAPSIDAKFQSKIVQDAWGRDGAKGGISDEQADQALRALTAWKRGYGFLDAADVGVGKTRIAGTLIFEAIAQGETRIVYTTKNAVNVADAIAEFRRMATGDPEGTLPFQVIDVSQYKDVKAGTADLPTPKGPTVYIAHAFNFAPFAESLSKVEPTAWIADEAHEYRNIAGSNRGMTWAALHESMLNRGVVKFAYFTATPAVTLDELGYLYGLREWKVGDFNRWVLKKMGKYGGEADDKNAEGSSAAAIQQVKTDAAQVGDSAGIDTEDDKAAATKKKPFMRGKKDVFQSKVTPAETEQVMRELKGSGKYVSVDLWRGGVQFGVDEVDIMGDTAEARAMRARYDQAAELVRDISLAARKFGRMNKKVKGGGLERSMIQGYMKQLLFELRMPRVLELADEALGQGKQVVISVHSVAGDAIQEEGVALEDTEIPPNKRLESAINAINVQHVEKEGTGMEAEYIDLGEIPEALMARAQLLERLRALKPLQDPIRRMEDHFGQNKVAAITGRVPAKQRTQLMGQFQSGQRKVAIISPAGKIGISLHDVNGAQRRMIVADYEWSADLFKQELGRVDRTGQKSSPEVILVASNGAGERKFAATIAARMASLGATSKGSAEATGTDALDQFDMSGDIAKQAMHNAVEIMDSHDRDFFTGSKFSSFQKLADDTEELQPKRRPSEEADMRSFLLEMLMFPLDSSNRLLGLWEQERDALMTAEVSERQAARRTTRMTGQVLRITELSQNPPLTMYEVKEDSEDRQLAVVQGFVTEFINEIQRVRGPDEKTGVSRTRRYVQFTEDGGELISGLELNSAEVRRVKEFFGANKRTVITPDDAWNDLQLGEKIQVQGEDPGEQWTLHPRRDGRLEIKGAKVSQHMDALKKLRGVVGFDPKGFFFVKPDQGSLKRFLETYKPVVGMEAVAPSAPQSAPEPSPDFRTDPRAGFAVFPTFERVKSRADIPDAIASSLDEVEERWQAAHGIKDPTIREQVGEALTNIKDSFRRHYRHLNPNNATEALVADILRQYEASPAWAKAQAYENMSDVVQGLGPRELDLFTRLLILPDIQKDIEAGLYEGKELPYGYPTPEALAQDLSKFEGQANDRVREALDRRGQMRRTAVESLVREGLLDARVLEEDRYYHRQVMDYLNANQALGTSTGGDVRMRTKGFQRQRVGGTDFNTRYDQAEFEWLAQSYAMLARKETLERVREAADIKDQLKREAKGRNLATLEDRFGDDAGATLAPFNRSIAIASSELQRLASDGELEPGEFSDVIDAIMDGVSHGDYWPYLQHLATNPSHVGSLQARTIFKAIREREEAIRAQLGKDYIDWKDPGALARLRPGYRAWQPEKGNHFFMGNTIEEQALQRVLAGSEQLTEKMVRQMLVVGGPKETWIVPDGVAVTLERFNEFMDELPDQAWRSIISSWKQWTLLNPARVLKYNLNNMSGDLDIVMAYDPKIAGKYLRRAVSELRKGKSPLITEARKLGVVDSGFSIAEVKDISDTGIFKALTNEDGNAFQRFVDGYWDNVRGATTFRENMLRLASFMYFREQLEEGKTLYGASHQSEIDAIAEKRDRAAKLARELIGDYGNISHAGRWLRTHMFPFYSWMEINAPRYVRLAQNASVDEAMSRGGLAAAGAKKVATSTGALMLRANILFAMVALWNRLAREMWDLDDDEVKDIQARGVQVILGRTDDGNVHTIGFNGALGDFLEWMNLQDAPQDLRDLLADKKDLLDMAGEAVKAPIERLVNAMEPVTKTIFEVALGGSTYPTFFEEGSSFAIRPRMVRDPLEHIASSVSLAGLYRRVTGRPVRGDNLDAVSGLVVYQHDPDEASYWSARGLAQDWLEEQGSAGGGGGRPTRRDNALYYYKTALRWGDEDAATKWRERYFELGGTDRGMAQSIRMSHPLGLVSQEKRSAFLESLDAEDRQLVERAVAWHSSVYGPVGAQTSTPERRPRLDRPRRPTAPSR